VKKNASLARKVALSCRILAKLGLLKETTGHVSARNSTDQMVIRGPRCWLLAGLYPQAHAQAGAGGHSNMSIVYL
jgi:ribulose-5-phosphate 4-epimerase/fuculose-1-phosphate aldolase